MQLLHSNIIVKLDPKIEETMSDNGVLIPDSIMQETDGGSFRSAVDENAKWLLTGVVEGASRKALTDYEIDGLKVGSRVKVSRVATSPNHYYYPNNASQHSGHILINVALLESIED